ncbi:hypothetical protein SAMN05216419_10458 [Nitrosomonas cryotolerans]|uniref:Uncharacterized protein n=1 Tax=Nitrosomonas cryotolerans ATCC 49181 TaxID=1131553 RepID=A0A1N6FDI2_9PROT|nr:hypothetical protein [Nitrosomonas cryotolerans]SFQ00859.1 hypothetical protein SAMN05216419_10458 [Nitrosomonas cryotolerans]SIN93312.1 hypothetical protein SAMN02743940_0207 [Nitrosomonas cryotolerans ATCC 49181]
MSELITELINNFSFNTVADRSWLEIASIVAPSLFLIILLFGLSFSLSSKKWKITAYIICTLLAVVFLPYELLRQSTEISKAEANIDEMQVNLKALLNAANLDHLEHLTNKEVASNMLEGLIDDLNEEQKKDLIFISWLITENEKQAQHLHEDKQKVFVDEIKRDLSKMKNEIIESREPTDKISGDILNRIDDDVSDLIEKRMQVFNQKIDATIENFQTTFNSFVQKELNEYKNTLDSITQKNIHELANYTQTAKQAFAQQVDQANKESLQKLEDTKESIDNVGATIEKSNLKDVVSQVQQLSTSIDYIQKKNDILFEYSECLRTTGLIDFSGRENQCKNKLKRAMSQLIDS